MFTARLQNKPAPHNRPMDVLSSSTEQQKPPCTVSPRLSRNTSLASFKQEQVAERPQRTPKRGRSALRYVPRFSRKHSGPREMGKHC
ncbi:unnamed protein product [Arctogadus glacialis]